MLWQDIETHWHVIKPNIKLHWDKLSYQQLSMVAGDRARFSRLIQDIYGIDQQEAEQQLSAWQQQQININGHFFSAQPVIH